MASRQGSSAQAASANFHPSYEWHDGDESSLLHLHLPGLKKEGFRVHVDPAGRLTVLAQRPAGGGAGDVWFQKVFQLPSTSNLDEITGRYDGTVLSLTVPKLPSGAAPLPPQAKEEADDDIADRPEDQKSKFGREAERRIEAAKARLPGRQRDQEKDEQTGRSKKPPATKADEGKEEPKAEAAATPSEKAAKREDAQEDRAKPAEYKAKIEREAERRIQAARARLAAEREKKRCWKERPVEEGFKWGEAAGKNKEVIAATVVAAFTLGVFVSHRLLGRN